MNKKKLDTIYDYLSKLQDQIEYWEKVFNDKSSESASCLTYGQAVKGAGKLIRGLRIKFLELRGVKTDYRGNILVSEKDWKKLKAAGTELDEIVGWNPDYKKVSNRLWKVINHVEGIEKF